MKRLLRILLARLRANLYILWYFKGCECCCYDSNNRINLIMVADPGVFVLEPSGSIKYNYDKMHRLFYCEYFDADEFEKGRRSCTKPKPSTEK